MAQDYFVVWLPFRRHYVAGDSSDTSPRLEDAYIFNSLYSAEWRGAKFSYPTKDGHKDEPYIVHKIIPKLADYP